MVKSNENIFDEMIERSESVLDDEYVNLNARRKSIALIYARYQKGFGKWGDFGFIFFREKSVVNKK